jgi:hypothetical protein
MSRDIFLPRPESEKLSCIEPLMNLPLIELLRAGIFSTRCWVRHGPILKAAQARGWRCGQLWFYPRLMAIAFSGYPKEHSVIGASDRGTG